MCRVVNKFKEPFDVYIGRGSIWGNPFPINDAIGDTREVVIEKFRQYLYKCVVNETVSISQILELDGKTLGCYCKPKACHGDVILKAVQYYKENK